jgi:transcriptional regulator with XRE-family HTH domain
MRELDDLTSNEIVQIRALSDGTTQEQVAECFNIDLSTVRAIQSGQWHTFVDDPNEMRLTKHDLVAIRQCAAEKIEHLAERYHVPICTITKILNGDSRVGVLDLYDGPERRA